MRGPTVSKEWFLEQVQKGKTKKEIASLANVTYKTVQNWEKTFDVKTVISTNRKIFFNETFFENIDTEEKAYILGFIMADGFIDKLNKTLVITLHKKDINILEKIIESMEGNAVIHQAKRERITVNFCSKKLVNSLSKYGVVRNKTQNMQFPNFESFELYRHFLRGYFDGDGHIGERQCALIVGSDNFKDSLNEFIKTNFGLSLYIKRGTINCWRVIFSRRDAVFIKWIYSECNIYLDRKYKSFVDNWSAYRKE